ncbi:unnamed protein product [Dicrocoelium dendriticum]|nr:unnamed protein product [Dicrocoelium dendriticum]
MTLNTNYRHSLIRQSPKLLHLMEVIKRWGCTDPRYHGIIEAMSQVKTSDQCFFAPKPEALLTFESFGCERSKPMRKFFTRSPMKQKRLLGAVFDDRVYLKRLLVNEFILASLNDTSEKVRKLAKDELSRITEGYEVSVRHNRWDLLQAVTGGTVTKIRGVQRDEKEQTANTVLNYLWKMYVSSQYDQAAQLAVQILCAVDDWPGLKPVALKWRVQADLCHIIGLCLDGLRQYKAALHFFRMDGRLAEHADILPAKKRALDNIGRMLAVLGHYKEAIACWSERMKTKMYGEELAWLLYQLALCHTMLDDFKEAERYCVNCTIVAESVSCIHWALSGQLLRATVCALCACRDPSQAQMLQTSLVSLDAAHKLAIKTKRSCVVNAVLGILRTVHGMFPTNMDAGLLKRCWSSTLLELLREDTNNRTNFNLKALRDLLVQVRKTSTTRN